MHADNPPLVADAEAHRLRWWAVLGQDTIRLPLRWTAPASAEHAPSVGGQTCVPGFRTADRRGLDGFLARSCG